MTEKLQTTGQKLNFARKTAGMTFNDLAELIGESATGAALNTAFNRDTVKESYVTKIIEVLGINKIWFETLEGDVLVKSPDKDSFKVERDQKLIPLFDSVATAGMRNLDMSPVTEPVEYIDAGDWFPDATAAIRIHGDSMYPDYHSGSIAALKEVYDKSIIIYGQDYVIETNEYRVLKRLQKGQSDHSLLVCSSNSERWEDGSDKGRLVHEPFEVGRDDIIRYYLVLGTVRRNHSSKIVYNQRK